MKSKPGFALCLFCLLVAVTGCSYTAPGKKPVENTAFLKVGRHLEVNNTNDSLILYDYNETLASDGLYYASWRIGDAIPYENRDEWLEKAESNYDISAEEETFCNGQPYLMITYTFSGENNPYARGVSAFGVYENSAVCIELTCREDFAGDLPAILTEFLENCTYIQ